jgi:hypothetical protein
MQSEVRVRAEANQSIGLWPLGDQPNAWLYCGA